MKSSCEVNYGCYFHVVETRRMSELVNALIHRVGDDIDRANMPNILVYNGAQIYSGLVIYSSKMVSCDQFSFLQYEDEDRDRVILASDSDLVDALEYARSTGLKVCFLNLVCSRSFPRTVNSRT